MRSCNRPGERQMLTIERLNFGEHPLPPQVLVIYVTEVRDEEGLLSIRLAVGGQLCSFHNAIPEMGIGVSEMQGGKTRNGKFLASFCISRCNVYRWLGR